MAKAVSAVEKNKAGKRAIWSMVQLFNSVPQLSHLYNGVEIPYTSLGCCEDEVGSS